MTTTAVDQLLVAQGQAATLKLKRSTAELRHAADTLDTLLFGPPILMGSESIEKIRVVFADVESPKLPLDVLNLRRALQ